MKELVLICIGFNLCGIFLCPVKEAKIVGIIAIIVCIIAYILLSIKPAGK